MSLNLKYIYSSSWKEFLNNWAKYLVATIIVFILTPLPFIGGILQMMMTMLILNAALKSLRGNSITFADFFNFKETFNGVAIAYVAIIAVLTYITQILSQEEPISATFLSLIIVVLGIILFPLFVVVIDKNLSIVDTFKYSAKLTKGARIDIILAVIVNFLISLLGALVFLIGLFVAFPVISISIVAIYLALEQKINQDTIEI